MPTSPGFFDVVSHDWLIRFVEHRVRDRRVIRLIRKWLKAGVMEDGQVWNAPGLRPRAWAHVMLDPERLCILRLPDAA